MKKILLLIFVNIFFSRSFSQNDSILYNINFFYQGTTITFIQVARYDTGFNNIPGGISIPTCNWGCGVDYTAFDRKHNVIYVNHSNGLYLIDPKTGSYSIMPNSNINYYAFNCGDTTMYCARYIDSLSTRFFHLAKIYPTIDSVTVCSGSPFYIGKKLYSPTIDEKNNRFCFLDSLYRIVGVSLTSGKVTNFINTNLNPGQTNYGLRYNPNDSLMYTILTDSASNSAFLRKVNVNTGSVFTYTSNINATGYLPTAGSINQIVDIDYFNNSFYFTQCDCAIFNPGKNVVFNKVDIKTGQILKSNHLTTYSHHSYVGFVYGQITDCVFTGKNEFETPSIQLPDSALPIGIMPNPSNNIISLTNLTANFTTSIEDNLGRLVCEKIVTMSDNSIDISTLSAGLYYLKLIAKDSSYKIFKLIKQ